MLLSRLQGKTYIGSKRDEILTWYEGGRLVTDCTVWILRHGKNSDEILRRDIVYEYKDRGNKLDQVHEDAKGGTRNERAYLNIKRFGYMVQESSGTLWNILPLLKCTH